MAKSAFNKSAARSIISNWTRFFFIVGITLVGIAFVTGIGGIAPKVTDSMSEKLKEAKAADLILKYGDEDTPEEEALNGFNEDEYNDLDRYHLLSDGLQLFQLDLSLTEEENNVETRLYAYPEDAEINTLEIREGRWPNSVNECVIEEPIGTMISYEIGDTITIDLYDTFGASIYESISSQFSSDYLAILNSLGYNINIDEQEFKDAFKYEFTITGFVKNPLMFVQSPEYSQVSTDENGDYLTLDRIIYTDFDSVDDDLSTRFSFLNVLVSELNRAISDFSPTSEQISLEVSTLPITDIYLYLDGIEHEQYFDQAYLDSVNEVVDDIKARDEENDLFSNNVTYLTMEENFSYRTLDEYKQKIDVIAAIFPIFFIAVVALVVLTTSSRMVDEERAMLGCYKSLGYSNARLVSKYLAFSGVASAIGAILGVVVGVFTLPIIVYPAFGASTFYMPEMTSKISISLGIISSIAIVAAAMLVTLGIALKELSETAADLLRPKAPKAGKKILLERIGFIWNHLKFKYKSTFRNVFRYKSRLLMIVISTLGCTALIFAGCALFDISGNITSDVISATVDMSDTIKPIAVAIIVFAGSLTVLVVFNLANMNIGERHREIASLAVLGYYPPEVNGYIYREIFIMCLMGIALGLPAGAGFVVYVFHLLGFGNIADVHWYTYLASAGVAVVFVLLVRLFIIPKTARIDMNDSLKSVE